MPEKERAQWIVPTNGAKTLPVIEILTGRGFITGKSGSGKSNSASVIAEELLENNYNLLIIDPEGEYYGLKEEYEILHVGNGDLCDVQVGAGHGEQIAEIALERNMPVIVDVSDYLDADESEELIANTVRSLFRKEKDARKPFLVMIEEMQEYLPQQGGNDELAELLERVAKRGRKRGLGMLGMSQRPSSVDKDFITQCDWMLWHRLTWQNDISVVRNVLGPDVADEVEDLDTGEGYLMTDWDESVERVQFKRKRTHDAGATPGLESYERPDLKSVSQDLVREFKGAKTGTGDASARSDAPSGTRSTRDAGSAGSGSSLETGESGVDVLDASGVNDADSTPATAGDGSGAIATDTPGSTGVASEGAPEGAGRGGTDSSGTTPGGTTPGGTAPGGTAPGRTASGGTGPDSSRPDLPGSISTSVEEIDAMAEADLRELARSLHKRNRILEDEVAELRSILQNVERRQRHDATAEESGSRSNEEVNYPGNKPVPPEPPVDRKGVAGNLVEFVAMVVYLTKLFVYRLRVKAYNYRSGGRANAN